MKIAFFDRDGTIIKDYPDEKWSTVTQPEFLTGSIETLQQVMRRGFKIIIITNQYLINEGYISIQQYEEMNEKMMKELTRHEIEILDVFIVHMGGRKAAIAASLKRG